MTTLLSTALPRLAAALLAAALAAPAAAQDPDPAPAPAPRGTPDPAALLAEAEALHAEGSWALARALWQRLDALALDAETARWVDLRFADAAWRDAAASESADESALDAAREALEALVEGRDDPRDRDRVWAEAHESLGDLAWDRHATRDWNGGWEHYRAALAWWGASTELELARRRYLSIVFDAAEPSWWQPTWRHGRYGNRLPLEVARDAARIAVAPADEAEARLLLARALLDGGTPEAIASAERELERVLALGRDTDRYDDALFELARFHEDRGDLLYEDSGPRFEPDLARAVALYRRLVAELDEGETPYHDDAQRRIERLTSPDLAVSVDRFFVPGSLVTLDLRWRNVERIDLALVPFDLTQVEARHDRDPGAWIDAVDLSGVEPLRAWTREAGSARPHASATARDVVDGEVPAGAYLLVARAGGETARALVLVSEAVVVAKRSRDALLAWVCDLETGEPRPDARVRLWERWWDGDEWRTRALDATTGADGLARLDAAGARRSEWLVAARDGADQALALGRGPWIPDDARTWRVHAFAERPVVRPGETAGWKVLVRTSAGRGWETPAGTLDWRVRDARGEVAAEGELALSELGTAHAELAVPEGAALGVWRLELDHEGTQVATDELLRVEEYRAPEFEVTVRAGGEDGAAVPRLGDPVPVEVVARAYHGAPVPGARVEVLVHRRPYRHVLPRRSELPWLDASEPDPRFWGGPGPLVRRETLVADADGVATLVLDTSDLVVDHLYTLEARVVDAARREVVATAEVKVTRAAYFVRVDPTHRIHRPGEPVEVEVLAQDANGRPVAARGTLEARRERWVRVWTDPEGRRREERELRAAGVAPRAGEPGWQLVHEGWEGEVVASATVATGADGTARWTFRPERDGFHRVLWRSADDRGVAIEAEAHVHVADEATTESGWRSGGIDVVVDRATAAPGEELPVMLVAPASGRWALVTVEGETLHHHEVVRLEGNARLLRLPLGAEHVPNVWIAATSVADRVVHADVEEVLVPPADRLLDVAVSLDAEEHLPGAEATLSVRVTGPDGEPVAGEVALAVRDEALSYVAGDLGRDVRRTFYGERAAHRVARATTTEERAFVRLVRDDDGEVVDERLAAAEAPGSGGGRRGPDGAAGPSTPGAGQDVWFLGQGARGEAVPEDRLGVAAESVLGAKAARSAPGPGLRDEAAPGGGDAPRVRTDLRDVALWRPVVAVGADGRGEVTFRLPERTTRWIAAGVAVADGTRVGTGEARARTSQPLVARLATPRFLVVGDEATVTATLDNRTDAPLSAAVALAADGVELLGRVGAADAPVAVPAGGSARVDWRVRAVAPASATLTLEARAGEHGDAVEARLPVHDHGLEAFLACAGRLDGDAAEVVVDLPAARREGTTRLEVQVAPSLAVAMLDALPYLVDYPYGCTEQTVSRFVPAVVVRGTLERLGLPAEVVAERTFGGLEPEHAARTHPEGGADLDALDDVVARGLERLYDLQRPDGGWGWWAEGDPDLWMSAYVVWGLTLAEEAGVAVRDGVLERGRRFLELELELELVEAEDRPDLQAWALHALAARLAREEATSEAAGRAFDLVWERRDDLSAYGRALLALAAVDLGRDDATPVLLRNLVNGVTLERPAESVLGDGACADAPGALVTAHWGESGVAWRWQHDAVESTAACLRALLALDPDHELVRPAAAWLVQSRRGVQWEDTRATALAVLALGELLEETGELAGPVAYEVAVNGEVVARRRLEGDELLATPSVVAVDPALLRDGANVVRVARTEGGPLWWSTRARFLSEEEPIPPRANLFVLRRDLVRLVPTPTLLDGVVYERELLADGAEVASGERIEVVLTVDARNEASYVVLEDRKAAGLEAAAVRSGEPLLARELRADEARRRFVDGELPGRRAPGASPWTRETGGTGRTLRVHQELRDRVVALFVDRLPAGVWELRYELRAEAPGTYHALPAEAHAMYVPEVRGSSAELRLAVRARDDG